MCPLANKGQKDVRPPLAQEVMPSASADSYCHHI